MRKIVLFDNYDPDKSVYGITMGVYGANGKMCVDDLFTVIKYLHSNEYDFKKITIEFEYLSKNKCNITLTDTISKDKFLIKNINVPIKGV
jgi:hypothetical protein